MSELEKLLHARSDGLPVLLRAGLAHLQFETIHPLLDGNGRVGRLVIILLLCDAGVLRDPTLYLSLYFKQHQSDRYGLLNDVRRTGDWEVWLSFCLEGIRSTVDGAVSTAQRLSRLLASDANGIRDSGGRRVGSLLRIHTVLKEIVVGALTAASRQTRLTFRTASLAMEVLVKQGIPVDVTGRRRNRAFAYPRYLSILNEGMEVP